MADRRKTWRGTSEQRFRRAYVEQDNGCWIWTKNVVRRYGQLKVDGRPMRAHRYAWTLNYGSIPDGMLVCHSCDEPLCVNPEHLFLGTPKDNIQDMLKKKRGLIGELNPRAILSALDVGVIRTRLKSLDAVHVNRLPNGTLTIIANEFGVSVAAIKQLRRGKTWATVA